MSDQADKLRRIVGRLTNTEEPKKASRKRGRGVITITSRRGGVSKTNITVNLAIVLSKMGYKVAILDVDFGFANVDVMLGISTKYTLLELIHGNARYSRF